MCLSSEGRRKEGQSIGELLDKGRNGFTTAKRPSSQEVPHVPPVVDKSQETLVHDLPYVRIYTETTRV